VSDPRAALLVIGHGTRDEVGQHEFRAAVALVAERLPAMIVEHAFLEFCAPTIAEGLARCAARGAERVTALPLLLFSAGHAKHDIPAALASAAAGHAGLKVRQTPTLDHHPAIIDLSVRRFREALAVGAALLPVNDTLLVLVGRGSHDAEANAEFARYADTLARRIGVGRLETCYLAMAEPSLADGLAAARRLPFRQVVVQPHLLFRGRLLDRLREAVCDCRTSDDRRRWIVAEPLGPASLLADAIVDLATVAWATAERAIADDLATNA
jgi:sirohydrochlorin cobaltochelatase